MSSFARSFPGASMPTREVMGRANEVGRARLAGRKAPPYVLAVLLAASGLQAPLAAQSIERVTFEDAVRRAVTSHPTIQQAAAGIVRAESILQQVGSRS